MRSIGLMAVSVCCLVALSGAPGTGAAPSATCRMAVEKGVLPVWARAGFSDAEPRMPHVLGANGEIAAIVFGYPLYAPPGKTRSNKILWVSRRPQRPMADLRIKARLMDGARPVGPVVKRTVVGGPGPSIVDLPSTGCWRLSLLWSGRVDTLDVRYVPPPR